jgi:transcriptional regulator with XRE-family HTH domain
VARPVDDPSPIGGALRAWRDRIRPEDVGLPTGGRRRTPGLRREELASLAGVSVDYLTRLEQGRATSPSSQMVDALARALRLSDEERTELHLLAGHAASETGTVPRHISPGAQRLLDRLAGVPLSVWDAGWNLIVANRLWTALHGDFSASSERERNSVWRHFCGSPTRVELTPAQRESFERAAATDLRRASVRYPEDRRLAELIRDLRAQSPRFAEVWDRHLSGEHGTTRKTIVHPEVGTLRLDCDVLQVTGSDVYLVAFTAPPGSEDADKLRLLDVIGTQDLTASGTEI